LAGLVGGMGIVYADPKQDLPLHLRIFDSIKSLVNINSRPAFEQNNNPQKPKKPVKKQEPITAVLPEELKRKQGEF
jgi:hypothetical protein